VTFLKRAHWNECGGRIKLDLMGSEEL